MGTRMLVVVSLASLAGCACGVEATGRTAAAEVADAGPPMRPLEPREEKPDPPAPACDPEWRELDPQPPHPRSFSAWRAIAVGNRLALAGAGFAAVGGEGGWSFVDATTMPEIEVGPGRQTVFAHAVEDDGNVFVVGSRMKILRFDGDAWHLEHRDAGVGPRATAFPWIGPCGDRLTARAIGVALEREPDGRWRRPASREIDRECGWRREDTPRPEEQCGNHQPWMDVVRCAAGWRVWSPARRRWLAMPDEGGGGDVHPHLVENASGAYLLGDGALMFTADGERWRRVELDGEAVTAVTASDRRVFALTEGTVWARNVCD